MASLLKLLPLTPVRVQSPVRRWVWRVRRGQGVEEELGVGAVGFGVSAEVMSEGGRVLGDGGDEAVVPCHAKGAWARAVGFAVAVPDDEDG